MERNKSPSPARLLLLIAASVAAVEIGLMVLQKHFYSFSVFGGALLDAALLIAILSPLLYYAAYQPLTAIIEQLADTNGKLAESRKTIQSLMDATTETLTLVRNDGTILAMNTTGAKRLGKTAKEIVGTNIFDLMPPELAKNRKGMLAPLLAGRKPLTFEDERNGMRFSNSIYPVPDEKGNIDKIVVFSVDITDQERAERRFQLLFKNMLEGFAYCRMLSESGRPDDFIYLDVNPAFERLTGLKGAVGKKVSELIPGIRESNPELFEIYGRVAAGGNPERFEAYVVALGIWFSVSVYCPEKEHFIAVFDNITERKRTEIALSEKEEMLRVLTSSARDSIIVLNDKGEVVFWNGSSEKMFGYPAGEVMGRQVAPFIIPSVYRESHMGGIELFGKSGKGAVIGKTVELTAMKKGGGEFPVELSLSSFQIKSGWHAVGIVRDITERKSSEQLLMRQEKLASIGTLSAGVAHEILNPLNIIGTIVQLMQLDDAPAETKERLGEIMAQIRRATKITNNLRMFAHVHKRETTAVDVHALFDKTMLLLEYDLNLDNITVNREYARNLPLVYVDADLLAQVYLNILNNARHALQEAKDGRKKLINIKTAALDGAVEIRLFNNGPPIPEDIIGKIFDPFFTTKEPDKGTGLGLSMAHTFIRDFGGTITVRNEMPEGVAFTVILPTTEKGGGWDANIGR